MILTLGTSPIINRKPISTKDHRIESPCRSVRPLPPPLRSCPPVCPLHPPLKSTPRENHLWVRTISVDLCVVTRTSSSLLPEPPDLLLPEPCEPIPPDPPDGSLGAAHRASPLLTGSKYHHSMDPFPHLYP
ncbi:hypothetical protein AALP_AA3G375600 [Arabis alpina]|uniref:Uncharacterized protein n=1 Tax=Arabis alpina TaxID=50452 RepID=A0A087HEA6_ARAAL|nr:hypothetical protein AALP_AA3G375600 [Arabis alpina]